YQVIFRFEFLDVVVCFMLEAYFCKVNNIQKRNQLSENRLTKKNVYFYPCNLSCDNPKLHHGGKSSKRFPAFIFLSDNSVIQ
ncbi:MAG: hypothetical protein UZ08_BCD001002676, partial [Candidatus Parvibacillus calidus]